MTPSSFRNLSYADQVEMIAEEVASARIQSYEYYLAEKRSSKTKRGK